GPCARAPRPRAAGQGSEHRPARGLLRLCHRGEGIRTRVLAEVLDELPATRARGSTGGIPADAPCGSDESELRCAARANPAAPRGGDGADGYVHLRRHRADAPGELYRDADGGPVPRLRAGVLPTAQTLRPDARCHASLGGRARATLLRALAALPRLAI